MKEYIVCAAVWFKDGIQRDHQPININNGYVVCGHRHHNCFMTVSILKDETIQKSDYGMVIQGFITSTYKFLDRKESGKLAFESGQIKKETDCLFSEDLY